MATTAHASSAPAARRKDWRRAPPNVLKLCKRIVEEFHPEKIILFGSHAYGTPHAGSDIDLLVILSFEGRSFDKSLEILNRVDPHFSVDLLARRPEEVVERYAGLDPLIRDAIDRGLVVYDRHR